MIVVKLTYDEEVDGSQDQFLLDIALRKRYKDALFEITNNLWRNWKHDESGLSIESLNKQIGIILTNNGLSYENFE